MNPPDRKYSKEHEWIKAEGDVSLLGVTHFAQDQLGDVVYIDLPKVGDKIEQFAKMGEIESVKTVSDLFSPISGEVVEVNQGAIDGPEVVNEDPYEKGWLLKVKIGDSSQLDNLLTADGYETFLKQTAG